MSRIKRIEFEKFFKQQHITRKTTRNSKLARIKLEQWFCTFEANSEGRHVAVIWGRKQDYGFESSTPILSPRPRLTGYILSSRLTGTSFSDSEGTEIQLANSFDIGRAREAGVAELFIDAFKDGQIPEAYHYLEGIASTIFEMSKPNLQSIVRPSESRSSTPVAVELPPPSDLSSSPFPIDSILPPKAKILPESFFPLDPPGQGSKSASSETKAEFGSSPSHIAVSEREESLPIKFRDANWDSDSTDDDDDDDDGDEEVEEQAEEEGVEEEEGVGEEGEVVCEGIVVESERNVLTASPGEEGITKEVISVKLEPAVAPLLLTKPSPSHENLVPVPSRMKSPYTSKINYVPPPSASASSSPVKLFSPPRQVPAIEENSVNLMPSLPDSIPEALVEDAEEVMKVAEVMEVVKVAEVVEVQEAELIPVEEEKTEKEVELVAYIGNSSPRPAHVPRFSSLSPPPPQTFYDPTMSSPSALFGFRSPAKGFAALYATSETDENDSRELSDFLNDDIAGLGKTPEKVRYIRRSTESMEQDLETPGKRKEKELEVEMDVEIDAEVEMDAEVQMEHSSPEVPQVIDTGLQLASREPEVEHSLFTVVVEEEVLKPVEDVQESSPALPVPVQILQEENKILSPSSSPLPLPVVIPSTSIPTSSLVKKRRPATTFFVEIEVKRPRTSSVARDSSPISSPSQLSRRSIALTSTSILSTPPSSRRAQSVSRPPIIPPSSGSSRPIILPAPSQSINKQIAAIPLTSSPQASSRYSMRNSSELIESRSSEPKQIKRTMIVPVIKKIQDKVSEEEESDDDDVEEEEAETRPVIELESLSNSSRSRSSKGKGKARAISPFEDDSEIITEPVEEAESSASRLNSTPHRDSSRRQTSSIVPPSLSPVDYSPTVARPVGKKSRKISPLSSKNRLTPQAATGISLSRSARTTTETTLANASAIFTKSTKKRPSLDTVPSNHSTPTVGARPKRTMKSPGKWWDADTKFRSIQATKSRMKGKVETEEEEPEEEEEEKIEVDKRATSEEDSEPISRKKKALKKIVKKKRVPKPKRQKKVVVSSSAGEDSMDEELSDYRGSNQNLRYERSESESLVSLPLVIQKKKRKIKKS